MNLKHQKLEYSMQQVATGSVELLLDQFLYVIGSLMFHLLYFDYVLDTDHIFILAENAINSLWNVCIN